LRFSNVKGRAQALGAAFYVVKQEIGHPMKPVSAVSALSVGASLAAR